VQSRAEPDGVGIGVFSADGQPLVHRTALASYMDRAFVAEAKEVESTTFVAHVRYGSTGAVALRNTQATER
jgi:glutamine amidotransferase